MDYVKEINRLRKEKKTIILAHYYQEGEIQDLADEVGDSLALAQLAAKTDAEIIVLCGVRFMAETAAILCPDKKVLIPDASAGCSLADSCPVDQFSLFVKNHPDHKVISYVNTSAAVKAYTDVVVTSSNAKQIVESFPKDQKLIFGPDSNLGGYINAITHRNMLLWNGCCDVHKSFSSKKLIELKKLYPEAEILTHPECEKSIVDLSDVVGSTATLIKYTKKSKGKQFIVCTESGVIHQMQKYSPDKLFIPAPAEGISDGKVLCKDMRLTTIEKLYHCLKDEQTIVTVPKEIRDKAIKPIDLMLKISAELGL